MSIVTSRHRTPRGHRRRAYRVRRITITHWNDTPSVTVLPWVRMRRPTTGPRTAPPFCSPSSGAHAAGRFAELIARLDLTPPQAGLLRMLRRRPGGSQREFAGLLGMPPSRFVTLADSLEGPAGLIERRVNPGDRRLHALFLTDEGTRLLADLRTAAEEHEQRTCAALSPDERVQLTGLLRRMAEEQGLAPGVHPRLHVAAPRPLTPAPG